MLLDQIDTMWVESIWLRTDRETEEGEEQIDRQRQKSLGTHGAAQTWIRQLQVFFNEMYNTLSLDSFDQRPSASERGALVSVLDVAGMAC